MITFADYKNDFLDTLDAVVESDCGIMRTDVEILESDFRNMYYYVRKNKTPDKRLFDFYVREFNTHMDILPFSAEDADTLNDCFFAIANYVGGKIEEDE